MKIYVSMEQVKSLIVWYCNYVKQ